MYKCNFQNNGSTWEYKINVCFTSLTLEQAGIVAATALLYVKEIKRIVNFKVAGKECYACVCQFPGRAV